MRNKLSTLVVGMMLVGGTAYAGEVQWQVSVDRILTDSFNFGGCIVKVSPDPISQGLQCSKGGWVTFACDGSLSDAPAYATSKSEAAQLYSSAQLAFITNAPMTVRATDDAQVDGYCVAFRTTNLK